MRVEIDSLTAPLWFPSWPKIVEDYSQCQLTNPNDRLPAIAGLARRFQCVNEDEFLAGLWKSKLHIGLLWRRVPSKSDTLEPSPPNEHRPSRRTPSWSWISINEAVEFSRKDIPGNESYKPTGNLLLTTSLRFDYVWSIDDCSVSLVDETELFGPVDKGHVAVTGPLIQVTRIDYGVHPLGYSNGL